MQHHAYLHIAPTWQAANLPDVMAQTDTDVTHLIADSFGIGESRELTRLTHLMPVVLPKRLFLLSFSSITVEAQNALLKLLEEPPETAEFHIVVASEQLLIPTVRSRMQMMDRVTSEHQASQGDDFFALPYADKLSLASDKVKAKDGEWLQAVYGAVVHRASTGVFTSEQLPVVDFFTRNFNRRGASKKMLLEFIAISL